MSINSARPFGLRDVKVFEITATTPTYAAGVDVPCVSELTLDTVVTEAMLEGDDSICATHANVEAVDMAITHGGVALNLYDVLFGATVTDSGTSPNDFTYMDLAVSDVRPYFGLIADSRTSDAALAGNTLFIGYKCKTTGGGGGSLSKGSFFTPQFNIRALPGYQDSDTIMRWINYQTATAIDGTWLSNNVHAA